MKISTFWKRKTSSSLSSALVASRVASSRQSCGVPRTTSDEVPCSPRDVFTQSQVVTSSHIEHRVQSESMWFNAQWQGGNVKCYDMITCQHLPAVCGTKHQNSWPIYFFTPFTSNDKVHRTSKTLWILPDHLPSGSSRLQTKHTIEPASKTHHDSYDTWQRTHHVMHHSTLTLTTHGHSRFRCPPISLSSVHDEVQLCNQARHRQTGVEEFFAQLQLEEFGGMDRDGNMANMMIMATRRDVWKSVNISIYGPKCCTNFHIGVRAWKESRLITLAYFHLSTRHGRVTSLLSSFWFVLSCLAWNFTKRQVLVSSLVTIWNNATTFWSLLRVEQVLNCKLNEVFFLPKTSLSLQSGFSSTSESLEAPEVADDRMRNPHRTANHWSWRKNRRNSNNSTDKLNNLSFFCLVAGFTKHNNLLRNILGIC